MRVAAFCSGATFQTTMRHLTVVLSACHRTIDWWTRYCVYRSTKTGEHL